jgi:hypothetical protein
MTSSEANKQSTRKERALISLLLSIPCVVLAGLTFAPVTYIRAKLDANGQPMFHPDGHRMNESDNWAGVVHQPIPHAFLVLAGFLFVRGVYIRFR